MRQARSYDCAVKHWIDVALYGEDRYLNDRGHYGSRIFTGNAGQVFSYGTHFEMARVLYDKKGEARAILVNGERASNTTTKHQGYVRGAVSRSSLPSAIIPYGALEAASIDLASIQFLHTEPDKWLEIKHETTSVPRWAEYIKRVEYHDDDEWSDEEQERWHQWAEAREYQTKLGGLWAQLVDLEKRVADGKEPYDWERPYADQIADKAKEIAAHIEKGIVEGRRYNNCPTKLTPTGNVVEGYVHHHHRGDVKGCTADGEAVVGTRVGTELHGPEDDGVWRWTTRRHILGESVISADVRSSRQVTCPDCKGAGYDTTGMQPRIGRYVWAGNRDQPDWDELAVREEIMVPVPRTDVDVYQYPGQSEERRQANIAREYRHGRMWRRWTRIVWGALPMPPEAYNCHGCQGRKKVTQPIMRRNVKFLSGFDHGEPHLAYFFCELPKCDATTVDEAYEALKPEVVKLAEGMGRSVLRQGDIFAVETTETTVALKKRAKVLGRRTPKKKRVIVEKGMRQRDLFGKTTTPVLSRIVEGISEEEQEIVRAASMLLGTNHQGTEVIQTHDGTIYARGCLWHVPDGRTNDHVRVKLGKAWHIIVKNTVPVRRA
jgi:hypothetical protein